MVGEKQSNEPISSGSSKRTLRPLTVELDVSSPETPGLCNVSPADCDRPNLEHHLVDDTCYVKWYCEAEEVTVQEKSDPGDQACLCRIFSRHDCIPSIQAFDEGSIHVRTNPPDRESLRTLIGELRSIADTVHIRSLVMEADTEETDSTLVSLGSLTDIERQTVELAILEGYYDRPRTADFDELAEDLGITPSALSKRLGSAEAKVMGNLFRTDSPSE